MSENPYASPDSNSAKSQHRRPALLWCLIGIVPLPLIYWASIPLVWYVELGLNIGFRPIWLWTNLEWEFLYFNFWSPYTINAVIGWSLVLLFVCLHIFIFLHLRERLTWLTPAGIAMTFAITAFVGWLFWPSSDGLLHEWRHYAGLAYALTVLVTAPTVIPCLAYAAWLYLGGLLAERRDNVA